MLLGCEQAGYMMSVSFRGSEADYSSENSLLLEEFAIPKD